jgi:sec-independent protein translocase protein TatA
MFGLGLGELILVLVIVLVLFSFRIPSVGENLGKGIRRFRKSLNDSEEIDITPSEPAKEHGDRRTP